MRRLTGLAVILGILVGGGRLEQTARAYYDIEKNFTLTPGGDLLPQVTVRYYTHGWASEQEKDGTKCANYAVQPAGQPDKWEGYTYDHLFPGGDVYNGLTVKVTQGSLGVDASGLDETSFPADADECANSEGYANSTFTVAPFGVGEDVTGTIRVYGWALADAPPAQRADAYAFSMAMVEVQGTKKLRNGKFHLGKVIRATVSGRDGQHNHDPVGYTVRDLVTSEVFTGTLYSVSVSVTNSPSDGFNWETNTVLITAPNLTFDIEFPGTNTSLQGALHLAVNNGIVTDATATGVFTGTLPAPGTVVPFSLTLSNEVEFDYDLGDFGGHDLDVTINIDNAGEASEESGSVTLSAVLSGQHSVNVSWPVTVTPTSYVLETTPTLLAANWQAVSLQPLLTNEEYSVVLPISNSAAFFRLQQQ